MLPLCAELIWSSMCQRIFNQIELKLSKNASNAVSKNRPALPGNITCRVFRVYGWISSSPIVRSSTLKRFVRLWFSHCISFSVIFQTTRECNSVAEICAYSRCRIRCHSDADCAEKPRQQCFAGLCSFPCDLSETGQGDRSCDPGDDCVESKAITSISLSEVHKSPYW